MAATKSRDRSRSRSPNRNSEWANNSNPKHTPSSDRFDGAATTQRSFHETMMGITQPPSSSDARASPNHNSDTVDCKSSDDPQSHPQKSPLSSDVQDAAAARSSPRESGNERLNQEPNSNCKEDGTTIQEDTASIEPLREDQSAYA